MSGDFRETLKSEYNRRRGRNAFYSLRAYARDLGLSPARLSEVLSAKKGLSQEAAASVARRLGLSEPDIHIFILSVTCRHSRSAIARKSAREKLEYELRKSRKQTPRHTTVVHWTTEATLKLSEREDFKPDVSFLSRTFGLPAYLGFGLSFLSRAGLLPGVPKEKAYIAAQLAGKRLNVDYEQILELARKAFLSNPGAEGFEHEPLLLNQQDLPEAREIVLRATSELKKLQSKRRGAKLHYFSTQLFCVETERKSR